MASLLAPATRSRKGFTLIELLVVVAIIAILAVTVLLILNSGELMRQVRDSGRLSDIATLNSAVNTYMTDQLGVSSFSLGSSSVTYLSIPDPTATTTAGTDCSGIGFPGGGMFHCAASSTYRNASSTGWIPINFKNITSGSPISALPVDPVNTTSSNFYYSYQTDGSSYRLVSIPESQKYLASAGAERSLFISGSNTTLAGGNWVPVPGNSTFGTNNFYVMKYAAGCSNGKGGVVNTPTDPVYPGGYDYATLACANIAAIPGAIPIVDISEIQAKAACAAIGAHLLTNDEYMTIDTNAAGQASNWTSGTVGVGGMYLGNANNASEYPGDVNNANGYSNGMGGTLVNQTTTNTGDERRTYTLSTGSVVWDMVGNVWNEVQRSVMNQGDSTSTMNLPVCSNGTVGWEWCNFGSTAPYVSAWTLDVPSSEFAPPNSSWNIAQGMGQVYSWGSGGNQSTNGFIRGGYWNAGAINGPFSLYLWENATSTDYGVGFRCAR